MRRRALLATLGTALFAGCESKTTDRVAEPDDTATETYAGTTLSEPKPTPKPPESVSPESAERFVREYERATVYNQLLPGNPDESGGVEVDPGGCGGAKSIDVEEPTTRVLLTDDVGVYVASAISGHVQHVCPGSRSSSGTRNHNFVTHYVGPDRHVAIPYNFYQCAGPEEPYVSSRATENATLDTDDDGYREAAPLKIQLYDFHPDDPAVAVWLTHVGSGDRVLADTYSTDLLLTVVANLAVRTGTYRLVARLADGTSVTREFDAAGPSAPGWNGTCVYVTPQKDLRALVVEPEDGLGIPTSRCHESLARAETTTEE
ncbi:hypothetical protein [Halorussus sp. MSC15.2]|uniref:hypothetical protein n=1 Tax=Halorussus sp. MSC15.2 TaxID=2283638 RepID=UPI0013D8B6F2|nr:hypothetical protein [Halorussus sp. MSC15.2]NEU56105.1 hypothetical protein [Halorussus sp. MSC15.2]